jgi:hypothetical protein
MTDGKKKKPKRPIFDSIRKPTAPPSRKIGDNKPEEKARPARRKAKHKHQDESADE